MTLSHNEYMTTFRNVLHDVDGRNIDLQKIAAALQLRRRQTITTSALGDGKC